MSRSSFYECAFDKVCPNASEPERWYVCLISSYQAYGGPEEGGWWETISNIEKYQVFMSEELALEAAEKIKGLAQDLSQMAHGEYGEHCLNQMEWLEARGLDSDFLPENDGPDEYCVHVCNELPVYDNTRQSYQ